MKTQNQVIEFPSTKNSQHDTLPRNTLTFSEAWDEVFERSLSKDKLYSECRAGRIPHLRIGTKIIFRRNTLEMWITEQEQANCRN